MKISVRVATTRLHASRIALAWRRGYPHRQRYTCDAGWHHLHATCIAPARSGCPAFQERRDGLTCHHLPSLLRRPRRLSSNRNEKATNELRLPEYMGHPSDRSSLSQLSYLPFNVVPVRACRRASQVPNTFRGTRPQYLSPPTKSGRGCHRGLNGHT